MITYFLVDEDMSDEDVRSVFIALEGKRARFGRSYLDIKEAEVLSPADGRKFRRLQAVFEELFK